MIYLPECGIYSDECEDRRITEWMPAKGWYFAGQVIKKGYKLRRTRKRIENIWSLWNDGTRIYKNTGRQTVVLYRNGKSEIALFNKEKS